MYDVIIIGTGPAGISAALTLKNLNKNFLLFGNLNLSDKINKAHLIRNYPGLPMVSGEVMKEVFLSQLNEMNIEITNKTVTGVYHMKNSISVLCDQEMFEAKSIILATGVSNIDNYNGELEAVGRGVSYCATCDGMLYKNKTISVISTSKEFEHEVKFLSELAKCVYFTPLYKDYDSINSNVELVLDKIESINSTLKVNSITYKNKGEVNVDGVFLLKSAVAPSVLVPGIEVVDNHIKINRDGSTNLKGIFACGDCTGRPYQYAKAVGEGNVCAHSAVKYLEG